MWEASNLSLDWERKSRISALLLALKHVAPFGHSLGKLSYQMQDDKGVPNSAQAEVQLHT